ncbi:MAG: hypothetical protein HY658_01440 [Actinobacteria bacterium]|nr:hypothetical protein [Actinomycetota bacterium]
MDARELEQRPEEEAATSTEAPLSFGPLAAAFLAAGIGALVLGILTTLASASSSIKDALAFTDPVGPLSGKTTIAVAAWVVSWPILHLALRRRDPAPGKVYWATALLVVLGLIGTFPTFFEAFAAE